MDNSSNNPLKNLEEKFPWISNLFSENKLLCILAGFLILAGTFKNISAGSAMVIGLGILVLTYALIDIKTIKKLTSPWISWERYKYSEEERKTAIQAGQKEIPPEIKQKLTRIIVDARKRKDEERAPEDYMVLAGEAWDEKKYEDGLRLAYAGLHLEPKNPRIRAYLYNVLGINYEDLQSYFLAEANYQKSIQADNNFVHAYYNLGNHYKKQEKYEKSETSYQKALELDPNDADSHNNIGDLYLKLNRLQEAEDHIKRAIELDATHPAKHDSLGELYMKQGKLDEAEAAFNKALELGPELKEPLENLEKLRKMRDGDEDSPDRPTLDKGKAKSKESPQ